jgi:outer membrane protein OmpA-like peptidoglycan-associated protein
MLKAVILTKVLLTVVIISVAGQAETFFIRKASFSSPKFDEFSPVYYKGGLVICSNRSSGAFSGFSTNDSKSYFKMYRVDTSGNKGWQETVPLPGDINSNFNNGPATFNSTGDTVYFSRNLIVEGSLKDIADQGNKLGLFFAVLRDGQWKDVQEMRFNDHSWNVTTPYLSPDGKRLYFASDKPDGVGGSDLYYSEWRNGYWNNPVNMGRVINTEGNEAFPFVNESGELFFSSDGHRGRGGKDIFFTRYADTAWITPVGLDPPVNSPADDFGFIADNITSRGWFSSNRGNMQDIYSFRTLNPQFFYCEEQKENNYCFSFADDGTIEIDPLALQVRWDFGGGKAMQGYIANHCFDGPGQYTVRQDIIDRKTGRVVLNKLFMKVGIINPGLPRISSVDVITPGKELRVEGEGVQGYEPLAWYWNFAGEGKARGQSASHTFSSPGDYQVKMMTNIREESTGRLKQVCVTKNVSVAQNNSGMGTTLNDKIADPDGISWLMDGKNARIEQLYSASDELAERAIFAVELFSSPEKIETRGKIFDRIKPDYNARAVFNEDDSVWSYIIDEQLTLMAALPAFRKATAAGYNEAIVRMYIPSDRGEAELWNFKRTQGTGSELYFVNNGTTISQEGIPVLDRLMLLLKRNPDLSIIVAVHTERNGSSYASLQLSQRQAQSIVDYLAGMGISKSRLTAVGYGGSRPIFPDFPLSEKIRNRRVDFIKAGQ